MVSQSARCVILSAMIDQYSSFSNRHGRSKSLVGRLSMSETIPSARSDAVKTRKFSIENDSFPLCSTVKIGFEGWTSSDRASRR